MRRSHSDSAGTFFPAFDAAERVDLSRGRNSPESQAAFKKLFPHLPDAQARLLNWLMERGDMGGTCREYAKETGKGMNQCSGRFTELVAAGFIEKTGGRREDCAVYRAKMRMLK